MWMPCGNRRNEDVRRQKITPVSHAPVAKDPLDSFYGGYLSLMKREDYSILSVAVTRP